MKKTVLYIFLILFCLFFIGCGTTRIITDRNVNADIYVNSIYEGKNEVTIPKMGVPKTIIAEAKYQGKNIGTAIVDRKFTLTTFILGFFTDGIGFIIGWNFPSNIIIPTNNFNFEDSKSLWDYPQENIWMKPQKDKK